MVSLALRDSDGVWIWPLNDTPSLLVAPEVAPILRKHILFPWRVLKLHLRTLVVLLGRIPPMLPFPCCSLDMKDLTLPTDASLCASSVQPRKGVAMPPQRWRAWILLLMLHSSLKRGAAVLHNLEELAVFLEIKIARELARGFFEVFDLDGHL